MYKRLTHTIVEEHFDHPMAAKIKAGLKNKSTRLESKVGRPTTEIFNETSFRQSADTYFNTFFMKINRISDSITETDDQLITSFEDLFSVVWKVKDVFNPFYQAELGERVSNSFGHIGLTYTMIVHLLKAGLDTRMWENSINLSSDAIANYISRYNQFLDYFFVRTHIESFNNHLIERAKAIKSGDNAAKELAENNARETLMKFKDSVVDGIIRQFPERFTR